MHYDTLILGNGDEAFQAAKSAAKQGQFVALVEVNNDNRADVTIQVLREAAGRFAENGSISISAWRDEVARSIHARRSTSLAELNDLGVEVFSGNARFVNATTLEVNGEIQLTADSIVLACGTKSAERRHLPTNGHSVIDVESLLTLESLPQSMLVVGAGRTGLDYATVLAKLGVEVTVIDEHSSPRELCSNLMDHTRLFEAQSFDVAFRLGDEVIGVQTHPAGQVAAYLASGKVLKADVALICIGREGRTAGLDLDVAGVGLDEHGRVWCDAVGQTWTNSIRAIGDVVGFRSETSLAG